LAKSRLQPLVQGIETMITAGRVLVISAPGT
jgi:hypothetical protein